MSELVLGGWVKLSTCDFPDRLATTVFAQGCPLECLYCHNRDLISTKTPGTVSWAAVRDFLRTRQGLLDAVVFSGGEPTRQPALVDAAREVKEMGFEVGIHTAGVYPTRIERLVREQVVDWVGLDIKTALERYEPVAQVMVSPAKILRSWDALRAAGVPVEIRTTVHPDYMTPEDVTSVVDLLCAQGVDSWVVQKVREQGSGRVWDWSDDSLVQHCVAEGERRGVHVSIRN